MDELINFITPHLTEIITFVAGAVATGIVWLTNRTSTKIDDDLVKKIAEEITKKNQQN